MTSNETTPAVSDFARLPEIRYPTVDPAGKRVAFYYDVSGRNEVHLLTLASKEERRISDGNVPRNAALPIAWAAGGDKLFFHAYSSGGVTIRSLTLDGDDDSVIDDRGRHRLRDVGPNGRYVLYTVARDGCRNLYRYDLDREAAERITDTERMVRRASFDPDAGRVAYMLNETPDPNNQDVYVAAADGSGPRRLDIGTRGTETRLVQWDPAGEHVLVDTERNGKRRPGLYHLESDTVSWFGTGDHVERAIGIHPDGDEILAIRRRECRLIPVLYAGDDDGGCEFGFTDGVCGSGNPHSTGFLPNGDALLLYTRADARASLYRHDFERETRELLFAPDASGIDPDSFADAEYVTVQSTGRDEFFGTEGGDYEIGCLLYEADGESSPGIVKVHGGPHTQALMEFNVFTQFLVSRGYTVLVPNYRGSTGRGRAFKNAIHGDWGGLEQEDVAAAGRWLKRRNGVDENDVSVYGISYGGYSVYMQLVKHPQLWTRGIACVGFVDLPTLYEETTSGLRRVLCNQLGDPEKNAELWKKRSPLTHVERLERPLLMIQGVDDVRCPVEQTRRFRDALVERGFEPGEDFVYTELEDGGHGSTDGGRMESVLESISDYLE